MGRSLRTPRPGRHPGQRDRFAAAPFPWPFGAKARLSLFGVVGTSVTPSGNIFDATRGGSNQPSRSAETLHGRPVALGLKIVMSILLRLQPVSGRPPIQISDIEKSSSRDSPRGSRLSVRFLENSWRETGSLPSNPRKGRHFRQYPKLPARDACGWLGCQDSNRDVSNFEPASPRRRRG
jgi:hypothetical protein